MRTFILATTLIGTASVVFADGHMVPGAHFIENWDFNEDGQVSADEVTEKRGEIFYMFDQNEDGALDGAEYDLFDETRRADIEANAGGRKGPMQAVDKAMDRKFNDLDGDGMVSRAEFDEQSARFFDMIDRTGDGIVDAADFKPKG